MKLRTSTWTFSTTEFFKNILLIWLLCESDLPWWKWILFILTMIGYSGKRTTETIKE